MSKVTKLRNRIRKRRKNKRKELVSFIVFLLICSVVGAVSTYVVIDFYNVTKHRTEENTHTVTGILEDTWHKSGYRSASRHFVIYGKEYSCAHLDTKNGWDNLEIGSNITVTIDNGDEHKSLIPVYGVECNGVTNFDLEDTNRESKILSIIFTPFFIIVALFAFVILAIRVLAFILTWFYNSEKKLKKKLKQAVLSEESAEKTDPTEQQTE